MAELEQATEIMRGEVKIAGINGVPRTVKDAAIFPNLAVHPSVGRRGAWIITHRPTGCALGYAGGEAQALEAATAMEAKHADAFSELEKMPFGQPTAKPGSPAIKRLLKTLNEKGLR